MRRGGQFWPEWELTSIVEVLRRQGYSRIPDVLMEIQTEIARLRRMADPIQRKV